jgi:hypothetical protein
VPCDLAAGLAGGGEDDAVFDGGLIGVRLNRDVGGLAGVWQPDLDRLPADHDGTAARYPPADGERRGQLAWMPGDDHHAKSRGNPAMPVAPSSGRAGNKGPGLLRAVSRSRGAPGQAPKGRSTAT